MTGGDYGGGESDTVDGRGVDSGGPLAPPTAPPSPSSSSTTDASPYLRATESLLRVTLAGFGGALAGLSVSRRRGTYAAATAVARRAGAAGPRRGAKTKPAADERATTGKGGGGGVGFAGSAHSQRRAYVDQELPTTWAMACLAFAGIVEFSQLVSPTSLIMEGLGWLMTDKEEEGSGSTAPLLGEGAAKREHALRTVGDFTLGGAVAGAIFQGSNVRTRAASRIDAAGIGRSAIPPGMKARTGVIAGALPGAALGFLAGVATFGVDHLQEVAQESQRGEEYESVTENDGGDTREESKIPADVKEMSMEELERSIDELRDTR